MVFYYTSKYYKYLRNTWFLTLWINSIRFKKIRNLKFPAQTNDVSFYGSIIDVEKNKMLRMLYNYNNMITTTKKYAYFNENI